MTNNTIETEFGCASIVIEGLYDLFRILHDGDLSKLPDFMSMLEKAMIEYNQEQENSG